MYAHYQINSPAIYLYISTYIAYAVAVLCYAAGNNARDVISINAWYYGNNDRRHKRNVDKRGFKLNYRLISFHFPFYIR